MICLGYSIYRGVVVDVFVVFAFWGGGGGVECSLLFTVFICLLVLFVFVCLFICLFRWVNVWAFIVNDFSHM